MRWLRIIPCLALTAMLAGACDGTPVEPLPDDVGTPSFKVTKNAWVDTWNLGGLVDFIECANDGAGEDLEYIDPSIIDIHYSSTLTPSGNEIWSWKVDYDTADPLSAVGLDSGDLWELEKAEDNGGSVSKPKGTAYTEHWQFNEFYKNQDGERIHTRAKFRIMIAADGSVKMERFDFGCPGNW